MKKLEINKAQIALRFAQAGQSYTQHAVVQQQIAQQFHKLPETSLENFYINLGIKGWQVRLKIFTIESLKKVMNT